MSPVEPERTQVEASVPAIPDERGSNTARWWRLGTLGVVLISVVVIATATGATSELEPERLRTVLASAGLCGALGFLGAFMAGNLLQLPGMAFVTAGIAIYGGLAGAGMALLGAVLAVTMTFAVVRTVGGPTSSARRRPQRPFVQKLLARLETRPVQTVFVLRTLFQTSPAVNVALALSRVRFRDYLMGSVAGLVLPVVVVAVIWGLA